ncbi:MAG: S-methyl-5'-thioadenosine phosphorylase [Chloroflexi bacterium]|nr:S-methyl-5'-thioadenosine phosphorylase [Chloroflexota bacterium]
MRERRSNQARVAFLGGSGLYEMEGLSRVREVKPETPFGEPSDAIILGEMEGVEVAFLPRHGRGHRFTPAEIPARANIYALKTLGVERVISVNAVGSLKEDVHPLDLVVPDQIIDRTRQRASTFFGEGIVVHVSFADPFCPDLSARVAATARETRARVHEGGTAVVMEGPAFSTRAESFLYRSWGASVIGMTVLPEAKLAREAEMCYASLSCVTDYDCWRQTEESVTVEMVVANLLKNVATSKEILRGLVTQLQGQRQCACATALQNAIITSRDAIPGATKERLKHLISKYVA